MQLQQYLLTELSFFKIMLPITLLCFMGPAVPLVTMIFAGRIDKDHLDGVGLATTIYTIVMVSFNNGYGAAFDTYAPQVYGSGRKKDLGTVLMKCAAQGTLIYLLLLGPYLNVRYVIDALPNPDRSAEKALFYGITVYYLRATCLTGLLSYLADLQGRYLAIKGHTWSLYVISSVDLALHILLNYVLVEHLGLGVQGLAIAINLSKMSNLLLSLAICLVVNHQDKSATWNGVTMAVFKNWQPMLKLGGAGIANVLADIGMYEMGAFISQFDGPITLSTFLIHSRITGAIFCVCKGVTHTSCILIGRSLGEGNAKNVKLNLKLACFNSLALGLLLSMITYQLRDTIPRILTTDPSTITMCANTIILLCLLVPIDHLQGNLGRGILVAFGKQSFAAVTQGINCCAIGIPIVVLTVLFTDLKIFGIYIGLVTFTMLNLTAMSFRLALVDLAEEFENTKKRLQKVTNVVLETFDTKDVRSGNSGIKLTQETKIIGFAAIGIVGLFIICAGVSLQGI